MARHIGILALLVLALASRARAGDKAGGFIEKKSKDGVKYVVYLPKGAADNKGLPVILFLHGSGESGTDGQKQTKVGLGPAIKKKKDFPFIAIFPQSQKGGWQASSAEGKRVLAILDEVLADHHGDSRRVYLTGLSMGGFGTWSLAAAHPERWAAIAPICGGGSPATAAKIKDLPCWCFHGDADKAVPVQRSRDMIEALKKAGGMPRYDEYPGVGHNSWDRAYGTAELYEWFLSNKRK